MPVECRVECRIPQLAKKNHKFFSKNFVNSKITPTFATQKQIACLSQQLHGAIAQLVEQRTENPCVPGSIPGGTTSKIAK